MDLLDQYFWELKKPLFEHPSCVLMPDNRDFGSRSGHRFPCQVVGRELRRWGVLTVDALIVRFKPFGHKQEITYPFRLDNGIQLSDNPWYELEYSLIKFWNYRPIAYY